jgi:hypothetical protein
MDTENRKISCRKPAGATYATGESGALILLAINIMDGIHGVLPIEISEPTAPYSRSQHRNLEDNPFSLGNKTMMRIEEIRGGFIATSRMGKTLKIA